MRQSWDLRPAGTVGGARLLFVVLVGTCMEPSLYAVISEVREYMVNE